MPDKFVKEPNVVEAKIGSLLIKAHLVEAKNMPATSSAMGIVANAEIRDAMIRRTGTDDYTLSLEKLLHAFDTFKQEFKPGKKRRTGDLKNYDLFNPCELTIFLLWQMRHILTHHGGVIDENCKTKYEKALKTASAKKVQPIINLPEHLEIEHRFTIDFENYKRTKECIFEYVGKRIPKKDLTILKKRSIISNIKIMRGKAHVEYEFGTLVFDIQEAHDKGFEIDTETSEFPGGTYDFKTKRLIVSDTGKSFPAEFIRK